MDSVVTPIAEALRDAPPALLTRLAGVADLETQLQAMLEKGRSAWPAFQLPAPVFVRHAAEKLASRTPARGSTSAMHAADLYLACACARADPAALEAFERTVMPRVRGTLTRLGGATMSVDDLEQELRQRIFVSSTDAPPRIATYSGCGALIPWVNAVAARLTLNRLEPLASRHSRVQELTELPALQVNIELGFFKEQYRDLVAAAFRTAIGTLDENERTLLRLYGVDGLTLEQIASIYRINRSTAYRRMVAASDKLLKRLRATLRETLRVTPEELDSIFRLVRSQLELSFGVGVGVGHRDSEGPE
jgi:RNA polymerase sigma-70 factor, ECF subfamily